MIESLADTLARHAPRRIGIIKPSSLGDIAHSLPILPALRSQFPRAHLTWVVNAQFRSLLDGHPDLDQVVVHDRHGAGVSLRGTVSLARLCARLRAQRFDLVIDLQGLLRSGLMAAASGAPLRVGPADAREGAGWFYTHRVDAPRKRLHAVDRVMRCAQALGAPALEPVFRLPITASHLRGAQAALAPLPCPRLVLNMGARWVTKRWPVAHFAAIARRAADEFGAGLVAVGSAEDRPLAAELRDRLGSLPVLDLSGRTTLLELAALARCADLFLSNDSGPLHLAAAAGASVLGIYTCTSPQLTGPYGPRAAAVQSCLWCAPSFLKRCPRLDCFVELSPDRVWPSVRSGLERARESAA